MFKCTHPIWILATLECSSAKFPFTPNMKLLHSQGALGSSCSEFSP